MARSVFCFFKETKHALTGGRYQLKAHSFYSYAVNGIASKTFSTDCTMAFFTGAVATSRSTFNNAWCYLFRFLSVLHFLKFKSTCQHKFWCSTTLFQENFALLSAGYANLLINF